MDALEPVVIRAWTRRYPRPTPSPAALVHVAVRVRTDDSPPARQRRHRPLSRLSGWFGSP